MFLPSTFELYLESPDDSSDLATSSVAKTLRTLWPDVRQQKDAVWFVRLSRFVLLRADFQAAADDPDKLVTAYVTLRVSSRAHLRAALDSAIQLADLLGWVLTDLDDPCLQLNVPPESRDEVFREWCAASKRDRPTSTGITPLLVVLAVMAALVAVVIHDTPNGKLLFLLAALLLLASIVIPVLKRLKRRRMAA